MIGRTLWYSIGGFNLAWRNEKAYINPLSGFYDDMHNNTMIEYEYSRAAGIPHLELNHSAPRMRNPFVAA